MAKEKVTLRKIPLKILIDTLVEIYEKGADYVDIVGIPDDTQDEIGIMVREEYYTNDPENEIDDDDELNDLI
jgi:hypothetical protein